jgi:hypothetical protein
MIIPFLTCLDRPIIAYGSLAHSGCGPMARERSLALSIAKHVLEDITARKSLDAAVQTVGP